MTVRLAALLICAGLSLSAVAEDCKVCTDAKLCLTHEATDDIAVKAASVKLKTKDMMAKREAVFALAEAQAMHMNVRSKKVSMELLRALSDVDVDVKLLAAEKLAELGEPSLAVQGMTREATAYKKLIGNSKPKKENEIAKWESSVKMLGLMYASLGAVKSPQVAGVFEEDVLDNSPFVAQAAANACGPLKGQKGIILALFAAMKKWLGPSQQPARPEGSVEAFFAMSRALSAVVENPPDKLDGKTQPQAMSIWNAWFTANEAKLK